MRYDVIIIGGGVVGCSIARELSRYQGNFCLLEKEEDVCCGTSKANSAIIHAGFDAKPGSLKAKLNVQGNQMMDQLAQELDIPFQRNGSFVVCTDASSEHLLEELKKRGEENGVLGLEILDAQTALTHEPNLSPDVTKVLFAPSGGIVCPFEMTLGLAENAADNGVSFFFDQEVTSIEKENDYFRIITNHQVYETKGIVNAAGVFADKIHQFLSSSSIQITARKGEYFLLDQSAGNHVHHTIFQLPTALGKGILVTPTVHGNLLVGPTAQDVTSKEDIDTTAMGLAQIKEKAKQSVINVPFHQTITSFAGLRAHEEGNDFILGEAKDVTNYFMAAGIESPGLSSAPAIGKLLAEEISQKLSLEKNNNFSPVRTGIPRPNAMSLSQRNELIKKDASYGQILCRCENVTAGEIINSITRTLGARSLDGIKRRTRAGMGRCQAGFCTPKTMELLSNYGGIEFTKITKNGKDSCLVFCPTKGKKEDETL